MKKKLIFTILAIHLTIFSSFTALATSTTSDENILSKSISVSGSAISADESFIITESDTSYYELRPIAEKLGATLNWDSKNKLVIINNQNGTISLNPITGIVSNNNVEKTIKYNSIIKNSKTYIPIEFISNELGARYTIADQSIKIQSIPENIESIELTDDELTIKTELSKYLSHLEINKSFSGQVLVENNSKVLIDRSYGYSNQEEKLKMLNSTTLGIGSVTKQFTAASIMQLVEKNKISLTDTISKYLPEVPHGDKITIHQLLTHTSGLYNFTEMLPSYMAMQYSDMNYATLVKLIKDKPLNFEPGTSFEYSNTGYYLLGQLVEKISGEKLEKYLSKNIFIPAGMNKTTPAFNLDKKLVEATGYTMTSEKDDWDRILLNVAEGAGFLASTTEDLYKWNAALYGGKIISTESLSKMNGNTADIKLIAPYAYGLFIKDDLYGKEYYHGGNTIGFTAENAVFEENDAQIIILANTGYADLNSIKIDIASILNGKKIDTSMPKLSTVSETQLNKYIGKYEIKDVLKINIFVKDGELYLQGDGQIAIKLDALSDTHFCTTNFGGLAITFDNKNNPTKFVLKQSAVELDAIKIK